MNDVVKVLEENRLYDDNYAKVYVNRPKEFFKNYKINKGSINKLPLSIKRNNDGFLMLDDEPYIVSDLPTDGHEEAFWVLLSNGSRVLIKKVNDTEIQNSILFKYLCKWLDVPCANDDVVLYQGKVFLLSPSFLSIDEYLFDYYDVEEKVRLKIDKLIDKASLIGHDFHVRKMLAVDMLAQNQDRFPNNFKVIKNKSKMRICPLYDNGILDINHDKVLFKTLFIINASTSDDDVFYYLMENDKFRWWCLKKIVTSEMPNLKEQIYHDKKIYIDDEVFNSFNKSVNDGKALILDNLKMF